MQPTISECPLLRLYLNKTRRNYKQNEKRFLRHLQNTILKIKQRKDLCQGVWSNLLNENLGVSRPAPEIDRTCEKVMPLPVAL